MGQWKYRKNTVQVITPNGVCESTKDITLLEKPEISSSSFPSYKLENGIKVIEICLGESITFTDETTTDNTDLIGNYWESIYGKASTKNYTIENVMQETKVNHKIINNCGCEDEEAYEIRIMGGEKLELSCYGTVCENSTVTYEALNANCTDYNWYVEGGLIVSGQHSPKITIEWGSPQCGYGVLGLDGRPCENFCQKLMSVKIPIITNNAEITGQTNLCQNEDVVLYSLPLWGSTEYTWTITPNTGYIQSYYENSNQTLLSFYNAGTYQLSATYKCDFLECGSFTSQTKNLIVRPVLKITSPKDKICLGDLATFTLNNNTINATWIVYNSENQQVYTLQTNSLNYTPTAPGKYRITAENVNYCNVAEFLIEVKNRPPAPTISNIPGSSVTCPNSSISLSGTATSSLYNLIWKPLCIGATPSEVSGENVNINFGSTVCNIDVFHYDKEVGCLSEPYTYIVNEFALAPHGLPSEINACVGSTLNFQVPNQSPNVLYEWTIDNNQYAATIVGDKLSNIVQISLNSFSTALTSFIIKLKREYCTDQKEEHYITVHIVDPPQVSIEAPFVACYGNSITFHANPNDGIEGHYTWDLGGYHGQGSSIAYNFGSGNHEIKLTYQTEYCRAVEVSKFINIIGFPSTRLIGVGDQLRIIPELPQETQYSWSYWPDCNNCYSGGDTPIPNSNTPYLNIERDKDNHLIPGYYCCKASITYGDGSDQIECFTSACQCVEESAIIQNPCNVMNINVPSQNIDICNQTITVNASYNNTNVSNVNWTVSPSTAKIILDPNNTNSASIKFSDVGSYTISGFSDNTAVCYQGTSNSIKIPFILDFDLHYDCVNHEIDIIDQSKYFNPPGIRQCTISVAGVNYPLVIPAGVFTASYGISSLPTIPTLYSVNLSYTSDDLTGTSTNLTCTKNKEIMIYPSSSLSISSSIPTSSQNLVSCDKTPIELIANITPTPNTILDILWNFGDGSTNNTSRYSIYHTFAARSTYYLVTATCKDDNGCNISNSINLKSSIDPFQTATLRVRDPINICDGSAREIIYNKAASNYDWYSPLIANPTSNINNTYSSGDYSVFVTDVNGCIDKKMTNVTFLNTPHAFIIGNTEFCQGDMIKLNGDLGDNDVTYVWELYDDNTPRNYISTFPCVDSKLSFTPATAGDFNVKLTVTKGSCSNSIFHKFTVHAIPPAPSISFAGNKCIDQPPVVLGASTPNNDKIYWNSGVSNNTAYYYSPGNALAYYYQQTSGCKSQDAKIFIEPAPNFDALLTGCYKKCEYFFPSSLNSYSLSSHNISWKWFLDQTLVANGNGKYLSSPLSLPLPNPGFGTYNLDVQYYGGNCNVKSPSLVIEKEDCPCAKVNVNVTPTQHIQNCKIIYEVNVTICNNGSSDACFKTLELSPKIDGINILGTNNFPITITPGNCQTFDFKFEVTDPLVSSAEFQIYDACNKCYKKFTVDIKVEVIPCGEEIKIQKLKFRPDLSNPNVSYFDFELFLPSNPQAVFRVWTEPSQVIDHIYNNSTSTINGLAMFDYGVLTQMAENEKVCFHVIMCKGDHFCESEVCIGVEELLGMIQGAKSTPNKENTKEEKGETLYLVPNPASTYVKVEGIEQANISELLLIDMTGKNLKKVQVTNILDIQNILTGTYIIRVINKENKVYYLKLIKN